MHLTISLLKKQNPHQAIQWPAAAGSPAAKPDHPRTYDQEARPPALHGGGQETQPPVASARSLHPVAPASDNWTSRRPPVAPTIGAWVACLGLRARNPTTAADGPMAPRSPSPPAGQPGEKRGESQRWQDRMENGKMEWDRR